MLRGATTGGGPPLASPSLLSSSARAATPGGGDAPATVLPASSRGWKSEIKVPTDSASGEDSGSLSSPPPLLTRAQALRHQGPSSPRHPSQAPCARRITLGVRGFGVRVLGGTVRPQHPPHGRGTSGVSHCLAMGLLWVWLRDLELCSPRATVSAAPHVCSISQICRRVCPSWRNLSEQFGPKEPPKAQAQTEPDPNHVAAPRPSPLCPHPFLAGFLSSSLCLPRPPAPRTGSVLALCWEGSPHHSSPCPPPAAIP